MYKTVLSLTFYLCASVLSLAQSVDHWETVIDQGSEWTYIVPSTEPPADWTTLGFNDSAWLLGNSGIGYGDNDDNTVVASGTISVYMRQVFAISDISQIEDIAFYMDYDDGFVAYLNGTEIARSNMSGTPPLWNDVSTGQHDATLFNGGPPEKYSFDMGLLNNGYNVLSVQVHNISAGSSDLSSIPFLLAGINVPDMIYGGLPWWFIPPLPPLQTELPIVKINTNGQSILDEPKVNATIKIIHDPSKPYNMESDPANEMDWFCGIEIRGESSQSFAKKSYGIEFWDALGNDIDTTFLNFPSEEDFILHGPFSDKSLVNNALTMLLANNMGHYASRTRFVELIINDDYKGVYVIMEKIKRDVNRVDISKLNPTEISGDDLTGGYIFRIDKGIYNGWYSNYPVFNGGQPLYFQFYYPDPLEIVPQQEAYISNYMHDFENAVADTDYINSKNKHYTDYIDLRSFVDTFILNELSKNIDSWRLSSYFHKDKESKGGRVTAGPFWDFNLAWGNANYCGGDITTGWEYYQCSNHPFWWDRMLQDTIFTNALKCRWEELRSSSFTDRAMASTIDGLKNEIGPAADRNFQRWPILGNYVWPNPDYFVVATTHDEVIEVTKNWTINRMNWMDANIPGEAKFCELYEDFTYPGIVTGGINDLDQSLSLYPNPANQQLSLTHSNSIEEIRVMDQTGRLVKTIQPNQNSYTIDTRSLPRGVYYLRIRAGSKNYVRKVIIEW